MRFGRKKAPKTEKQNKFLSEDKNMTKTLHIKGMTCNHCVMHVTKALEGVAGVEKADVDLKSKKAVVTLNAEVTDDALKAAVADAGYEVTKIA